MEEIVLPNTTAELCPDSTMYSPSTNLLPECDLCNSARCVPGDFVPEDVRYLWQVCPDGSFCIPDHIVDTMGDILRMGLYSWRAAMEINVTALLVLTAALSAGLQSTMVDSVSAVISACVSRA